MITFLETVFVELCWYNTKTMLLTSLQGLIQTFVDKKGLL